MSALARVRSPRVLALILLAAIAVAGASLGLREPEVIAMDEAVGRDLRVRGVLNWYGNEPHTWLGLLVDPDDPPEVGPGSGRHARLPGETVFELVADQDTIAGLSGLVGRKIVVDGELENWPDGIMRPRIKVAEYEPGR